MISYNAYHEPTKGSGGPGAAACPSVLDADRATELSRALFSASFYGFSLDPLPALLLLISSCFTPFLNVSFFLFFFFS